MAESESTLLNGPQHDEPHKREVPVEEITLTKTKILKTIEAPNDEPTMPIIPKNEPNCYLVVRNLVRPFTIKQLVSHLKSIVPECQMDEEMFWINDIKSFCYVKYGTVEQSGKVLKALNGLKWPSISPKLLHVDYANLHTMYIETKGKHGQLDPDQENNNVKVTTVNHSVSLGLADHLPEGDASLLEGNKAMDNDHEGKSIMKILDVDSLFNKTQALPSIYWLSVKGKTKLTEGEKEEKN